MRKLLIASIVLLMASIAQAQTPMKVKIFASPDPSGFVTNESSTRQFYAEQIVKRLVKDKRMKKMVTVADDAAVTIEVISYSKNGTGTSERVSTPIGVAFGAYGVRDEAMVQINKHILKAILRYGELSQELTCQSVDGGMYHRDLDENCAEVFASFVNSNAAKLGGK